MPAGITLAMVRRVISRHLPSRVLLIVLPLVVSAGRVHAHTAAGPGAITQEMNRCLMMVRIAVTRRSASPQKAVARPTPAKVHGRYDDYQVAAGTPLAIQLRTTLDSASGHTGDPVRGTLLDAVSQDGIELLPKGSTLHGKVTVVQPASRENRAGRLVLEFNVIEHFETRSLATIETRAVSFEVTLGPKEKLRDVRVESGERVTATLASPLKVRLPRNP